MVRLLQCESVIESKRGSKHREKARSKSIKEEKILENCKESAQGTCKDFAMNFRPL